MRAEVYPIAIGLGPSPYTFIVSLSLPRLSPLFSHLSFHSQGRRNPEAHSSHVTDTKDCPNRGKMDR